MATTSSAPARPGTGPDAGPRPVVLRFAALGLVVTWTVAVDRAVLVGAAPFFRYLLALVWSRTGHSVWAADLMHVSFNAGASLGTVRGSWPYVAAAPVVSVVVASAVQRSSRRAQVR